MGPLYLKNRIPWTCSPMLVFRFFAAQRMYIDATEEHDYRYTSPINMAIAKSRPIWICKIRDTEILIPKIKSFKIICLQNPRLALATILCGKPGNFLVVIGLVCSSFVAISSGTHRRAPWDPLGQTHIPMVKMGNELAARKLNCDYWHTWVLFF